MYRRLFWNPFNFRDILKGQEELKDIKINLDISHWVVCLERIFDSPESRHMNGDVDGWWGEVLEMLKSRCWTRFKRAPWVQFCPHGSTPPRFPTRTLPAMRMALDLCWLLLRANAVAHKPLALPLRRTWH